MIDPITMKKVWSLKVNDEALYNNLRIDRTQFILDYEKLDLEAFNRKVYWQTDLKTLEAWKIKPEKLSTEKFID